MSIKDASAGGAATVTPIPQEGSPIPTQARKRPLRTYGRRTIVTSKDHERTPPKQRVENTTPKETVEDTAAPRQEEEDAIVVAANESEPSSPLSIPPSSVQPKRTSILSYFRPVPSRSDERPPQPEQSEEADESTPPPPSPPPAFLPRKRRRLTTRPELFSKQPPPSSSDVPHETEPDLRTKPTSSENDATKKDPKKKTQDTSPKGAHGAPFISVSNPVDHQRSNTSDDGVVLQETSANILNQQPDIFISSTGQPDSTSGKKRARRTKKDLVQTTLSLAINPSPGFSICKDCGILYNPLNENDRTDHKRRHAAYLRSKGKGKVL